MPDLIPTLSFSSNIHLSGTLMLLFLRFIEISQFVPLFQLSKARFYLRRCVPPFYHFVMIIMIEVMMMMDDECGGSLICDIVAYYEFC